MNVSFSWDDSGLKNLQKNLKSLNGQHEVPIVDLMNDAFIRQHSRFDSFQALVDASGIENPEEFDNESFSKFIAAHTTFGSWDELKTTASAEYVKRKLGL